MKKQRLDFNFEVKSVSESGEFSGYGSVFNVEDSYGDVIIPGAFANSLNSWKEKSRLPAMLWQHDTQEPIGVYSKMEEDEKGLYVEGKLLKDDDPVAKRAYAHLKAGSISGLSIGFNYVSGGLEYNSEEDNYTVKQVNLWEVSLVTFPANDDARIDTVKSLLGSGETPEPKIVERVLRDAGLSKRQARDFMYKGYSAIGRCDADHGTEYSEAELSAKSLIQSLRGNKHG